MAERPSLLNGGKGVSTLQNNGGSVPLKFTVQEHEVTNQPQDSGSWNNKCDNPLGPK